MAKTKALIEEETTQEETTQEESPLEEAPRTFQTVLPRDPALKGSAADTEFFSVNGRNILVKTDELVELPIEFKEVIENAAKARMAARKYAEQVAFKDSTAPAI